MPFLNSAMSFGPIFTGTRFLFGPPTASRSGLTPRAPADATVCDCCACEPPPGSKLAEHAAALLRLLFLLLPRRGRLLVGLLLIATAGEAARPFGNRRQRAGWLGVERDVLGVARLNGRRRGELLLANRLVDVRRAGPSSSGARRTCRSVPWRPCCDRSSLVSALARPSARSRPCWRAARPCRPPRSRRRG